MKLLFKLSVESFYKVFKEFKVQSNLKKLKHTKVGDVYNFYLTTADEDYVCTVARSQASEVVWADMIGNSIEAVGVVGHDSVKQKELKEVKMTGLIGLKSELKEITKSNKQVAGLLHTIDANIIAVGELLGGR